MSRDVDVAAAGGGCRINAGRCSQRRNPAIRSDRPMAIQVSYVRPQRHRPVQPPFFASRLCCPITTTFRCVGFARHLRRGAAARDHRPCPPSVAARLACPTAAGLALCGEKGGRWARLLVRARRCARGEEQVGAGSETAPRSASIEILPGGNMMVSPPGATTTDRVPALTGDVRAVIMRTRWVASEQRLCKRPPQALISSEGWTRSPGLRAR